MTLTSKFWSEDFLRRETELTQIARRVRTEKLKGPRDLPEELCLYKSGRHAVYFAPFGLNLHKGAKVVIVGLTPGFSQTVLALRCFQRADGDARKYRELLSREVAFAGSMRTCLIRYLEELGIHRALGLAKADDIFDSASGILATCSLIRYPVFSLPDLKNYSGSKTGQRDVFIQSMIQELFRPFIRAQGNDCLVVPLGKYPSQALQELCNEREGLADRTLLGFPHTSGSNGHKEAQFQRLKPDFALKVRGWAKKLR